MRQSKDSASNEAVLESDPKKLKSLRSVSRRYTIAIACLMVLTMSVFWLISNYNTQNTLRQQADSLGQSLAQQTATLVTELVLVNDLISMNVVLSQITQESTVIEAAVLNIEGDIIAASTAEISAPNSLLPVTATYGEYIAPIVLDDASAGNVRIRLDVSYIEATLSNNLLYLLITCLIILVVAVVVSKTYFQYLVSFPVNLLNYSIQGLRLGEVETCPEPEANTEISRLIRQYNKTAEFLTQFTFIKHFADDDKVKTLDAPMNSENYNAAVLCVRIANFHYLASTNSEKVINSLLSKFYFLIENIAGLYNGTVEFCDDAEVIVSFTKSQLEDEQSFYAICAGQLFLRMLIKVLYDGNFDDPMNAKFKLAVHCGEFTPGLYSPLTGADSTVTGQIIDSVRSICDECPDNSLLVSDFAFQNAGPESRIVGEEFSDLGKDSGGKVFLCSNALASYRELLRKQSDRLARIMSQAFTI